jgi:5-methylcytosine-specific restriction protein B
MPIPKNISKEHIEKAIEEIQNSVIPAERLSVHYFLKIGNKEFPPKYVISIANKFANDIELPSFNFTAVEAKNFLTKLKFVIITRNNSGNGIGYFQQLKKFLEQCKTSDLTTAKYQREYLGLKVKVSFGQGNQARIPWIAFLKEGETVQNGIYPVYLYYKEFNLLFLAKGVSETNKPINSWQLKNEILIKQFFAEKGLVHPDRYGNSFVYEVYDLSSSLELDEESINSDLEELLEIYLHQDRVLKVLQSAKFDISLLFHAISMVGLNFPDELIERYVASLITKNFMLLTGLSGSGKTKLAQVFAKWICEKESHYKLIPVGADWTNREPLLGYPNALESGKYVSPENGVLELILEARENQAKPYFLILDEMNLSHVERYFADFLSAMESGEDIPLHPESEDWKDKIPAKIKLPKNLFIVGTVNIDETTYMFSPKVLDRANVIEFRVSETEMEQFLVDIKPLELESIIGLGAKMAASFVELANNKDLKPANTESLNKTLNNFFKELKKTGAEFGYRSATEIHRFVAVANQLDPNWKMAGIIDCAIMQKLLPKVHGSRRKLEPVLKTLGSLCLADGKTIEDFFNRKTDVDFNDPATAKYPLSLEKIDRMYKGLTDNGFTSYAEA